MTSFHLNYEDALRSYQISAERFSLLRKMTTAVLISGLMISLFIFGTVLIQFTRIYQGDSGDLIYLDQATWDTFCIALFFLVGAISCGFIARDAHDFNTLPDTPEEIAEPESYELVVDENNEFLKKHQKLAAASLILFLIANLMLIQF